MNMKDPRTPDAMRSEAPWPARLADDYLTAALGGLPELGSLRLAAWAHMLGFRGHFSTKSRAYSTTFSALRAERIQHQREQAIDDSLWPTPEADNTIVIAHWQFARRGHSPLTPLPAAEAILDAPSSSPTGGGES
jgi:hypothetical protein